MVIVVTENGRAVKFPVKNLRVASRTSGGVRGVRCKDGDRVAGMEVASSEDYLLVITCGGFGKMTSISSYPTTNRGGMGVRTQKVDAVTGKVAAVRRICPTQELMIITTEGIVIRESADDISILGRDTKGVWLMRPDEGDSIAAVTCLDNEEAEIQAAV